MGRKRWHGKRGIIALLIVGYSVPEQLKSVWTSEVSACAKDEVQNEAPGMGHRAQSMQGELSHLQERKTAEEQRVCTYVVSFFAFPLHLFIVLPATCI